MPARSRRTCFLEHYEHYITRCIRRNSRRRLFSPTLYLLILIAVCFLFPFGDMLFPHTVQPEDRLKDLYNRKRSYIDITLEDLSFTGYTRTLFGHNTGFYYYGSYQDQVIFVLLSPRTCEEGLPTIQQLHIQGIIQHNTRNFQEMQQQLADDLNWTPDGLKSHVSSYFINEPSFHSITARAFLVFYFASGLYEFASLFCNLLSLIQPRFASPCRHLKRYGNPRQLFEQAEKELASLSQIATEDMFVTEHFFIEMSNYGVAIVPIHEILWIYKHSTLHEFLRYHFHISYALHITARRHLYIHCPKNTKSDLDGIIACLSEANPDILVGFSEENRRRAMQRQEKS